MPAAALCGVCWLVGLLVAALCAVFLAMLLLALAARAALNWRLLEADTRRQTTKWLTDSERAGLGSLCRRSTPPVHRSNTRLLCCDAWAD